MKKGMKRTAALLAAALMLTSGVSAAAEKAEPGNYDRWGTSALGPGYSFRYASYHSIEKVNGIEEGEKEFILSVTVDGQEIKLYLNFPSTGGFRLHTEDTGYFEPESVQKIQYEKNKDSVITMKAEDGTKVIYTAKGELFALDVYNSADRWLFQITPEQMGFGYSKGELTKVRLEMPLAEEESIYGSGERFNELEQVGKRLLMWNVDCGYHGDSSAAELWRGYKNVPVFHSNRGYTLFSNTFYSGSADIGYTNEGKYTLEFQGPQFDFYIWTGTPEENLIAYTDLTGKSVLLPKWAYQYSAGAGRDVWRGSGSMYGKAMEVMEKYAELGTPNLAAVYVEGISQSDANVYNVFKKTGTRVFKWNAPDMSLENMRSSLPRVEDKELPRVKNERNPVQDSGDFIDFTSDSSATLLKNYLTREFQWGNRGGLIDFGELIQLRTLFRGNGLTGEQMHNFFPYWYAKRYNEAMTQLDEGDGFVYFSRAGCAGAQAYTAFFTGDQQASMEGLRQQLVAGLSASASGISMWGGDLAGYGGQPTDQVFARGMQFAAFEPVMRSHGTTSRFPWDYGSLGISTYQTHYWLRENLLNKIYSTAIVSNKTGLPVTEPMAMAYPGDSSLDGVYESYLFCDDFLVTPVLTENVYQQKVTFPKGTWYGLWDGEKRTGGGEQTVEAPADKSPVYIKAGAVVPVTVAPSLTLTDSMQDVETQEALLVTLPDENREVTYWKDEDTSVVYKNSVVNDTSFQITAGEGNEAAAVIVKGLAAYSVEVDGEKLTRLTKRPEAGSEAGFFNEDDSETVIWIGDSDWSDVTVKLGKYELSNLMKDAKVSDSDLTAAIDGDYDSSYLFSSKEGGDSVTFTLEKKYKLKNLVVKWTEAYADTFTLEASADGKNWTMIAEETEGYGGINDYRLDGMEVKYVRLSNVASSGTAQPRIYEVEAYGQAKIRMAISVWWILLLIVVILVAAAVIVIVILRKRGKGTKAADMVGTQEESLASASEEEKQE